MIRKKERKYLESKHNIFICDVSFFCIRSMQIINLVTSPIRSYIEKFGFVLSVVKTFSSQNRLNIGWCWS